MGLFSSGAMLFSAHRYTHMTHWGQLSPLFYVVKNRIFKFVRMIEMTENIFGKLCLTYFEVLI